MSIINIHEVSGTNFASQLLIDSCCKKFDFGQLLATATYPATAPPEKNGTYNSDLLLFWVSIMYTVTGYSIMV